MSLSSTQTLVAIIIVALVVVVAAQAAADVLAPVFDEGTPEAVGRAGWAYLTGLRTFAAAVLWNRLDPIFHGYYGDVPLSEQVTAMPTIRMVTWLDPQFIDGYYVSAWILAQRDDVDGALEVAAAGVEANPDSGILRANYAQILWLNDGDLDEAVHQAEIAVSQGVWRDAIEQHNGYATSRGVFKAAGRQEMVEYLATEIERLDAEIGDALPEGTHDHDGDGVPDH